MLYQGPRVSLVICDGSQLVHEEKLNFNALFDEVAFSAVCRGRLPNDGRWDPAVLKTTSRAGRVDAVQVGVGDSSRTYDRTVFRQRAPSAH